MSRAILLVDDIQLSRDTLRRHLESAGFAVLAAAEGGEGIDLARSHLPDLIICEATLGDMSGLEVLKTLRADPTTALTPFIVLAPDESYATRRKGMELGADDYLIRPVDEPALMEAVQGQLARYEQLLEAYNVQIEELAHGQEPLSLRIAQELRTPLIALSLSQEMMTDRLTELSLDQQRTLTTTMGNGVRRLRHLVEQMVLMSQLESGILNPSAVRNQGGPHRLWDLIPDAVNLAQQFAYGHSDVDVETGVHDTATLVRCHPPALKHALAELIHNAIKYSPAGRAVVIKQSAGPGVINITILDKGPGMTREHLRQVLDDIRQLGRARQAGHGLGMGLALARRLIEAHGGALSVKSVLGKGTQAIVGLPPG